MTLRRLIALILLISVTTMVAVCCCKFVTKTPAAKACSHCASQKAQHDSSAKECCVTKQLPSEGAHQAFSVVIPDVATVIADHTVVFPLTPSFKSPYINGPPGPVTRVPLYIQSHSLRI